MKIEKYFLTALFATAIALSVSAQENQPDAPIFYNSAQYREYRRAMNAKEVMNFKGNSFYIGTNALSSLLLVPNITFEWRRNERYGLSANVGGVFFGVINGVVVNIRSKHYLGKMKSWYVGEAVGLAYFAIKYPNFNEPVDGGGYGRTTERAIFASLSVTLGYMHRISRNFALDYYFGGGLCGTLDMDSSRNHDLGLGLSHMGISLLWQVRRK